jgi:hypothetical protein
VTLKVSQVSGGLQERGIDDGDLKNGNLSKMVLERRLNCGIDFGCCWRERGVRREVLAEGSERSPLYFATATKNTSERNFDIENAHGKTHVSSKTAP